MVADTRQASACHRWLRIDVDWRDDSSYGSNRVTLSGILFLLRLVIESECKLIELVVIILEIDIYRLLVFTLFVGLSFGHLFLVKVFGAYICFLVRCG